jgi:hypothetical protein
MCGECVELFGEKSGQDEIIHNRRWYANLPDPIVFIPVNTSL